MSQGRGLCFFPRRPRLSVSAAPGCLYFASCLLALRLGRSALQARSCRCGLHTTLAVLSNPGRHPSQVAGQQPAPSPTCFKVRHSCREGGAPRRPPRERRHPPAARRRDGRGLAKVHRAGDGVGAHGQLHLCADVQRALHADAQGGGAVHSPGRARAAAQPGGAPAAAAPTGCTLLACPQIKRMEGVIRKASKANGEFVSTVKVRGCRARPAAQRPACSPHPPPPP